MTDGSMEGFFWLHCRLSPIEDWLVACKAGYDSRYVSVAYESVGGILPVKTAIKLFPCSSFSLSIF